MQQASPIGLTSADSPVGELPGARARATCVCLGNAPQKLIAAVQQEWSACTAELAHAKLSSVDVQVTNMSDKEAQLPKILKLNNIVRALYAASAVDTAASTVAATASAPTTAVAAPETEEGLLRALADAVERAEAAEARAKVAEANAEAAEARAEAAEARAEAAERERAEVTQRLTTPLQVQRAAEAETGRARGSLSRLSSGSLGRLSSGSLWFGFRTKLAKQKARAAGRIVGGEIEMAQEGKQQDLDLYVSASL